MRERREMAEEKLRRRIMIRGHGDSKRPSQTERREKQKSRDECSGNGPRRVDPVEA